MPEFHMPINSPEGAAVWSGLDDIQQGFIEALFFTNTATGLDSDDFKRPEVQDDIAEGRTDGTIPTDADAGDIDSDDLARLESLISEWVTANRALCDAAEACPGYDLQRLGNDLYFTAAGHGVGFWCRDELETAAPGQHICDSCGSDEPAEKHQIPEPATCAECGDPVTAEGRTLGEALDAATGRGEINPDFDTDSGKVTLYIGWTFPSAAPKS